MKAAALTVVALSMSAVPHARAQQIPNSPWSVSTITGSNPACSMIGVVGQGRLSLTVLGAVPGAVHLQLDKQAWSMAPGATVRAIFHFVDQPDVQVTGMKGGAASVLFNLMDPNFAAWMHGFSAAQDATIVFPGTNERPWTFDLHGTTPAVNAMQQCITSQNIAGVPRPFVSVAIPAAVKPGSHCLSYNPAVATLVGTVSMATGYGPPGFGESPETDPKFRYARVTTDRPVCVTGGKVNDFEDVNGVEVMALLSADRNKVLNTKPWLGRHVAVTGTIDQKQVASEAATPLYVNVRSIQMAP